jgi:hypothetical protein
MKWRFSKKAFEQHEIFGVEDGLALNKIINNCKKVNGSNLSFPFNFL